MPAIRRHQELLTTLSEGVATLASSTQWTRYLETQARLSRYSFNNVVLIAAQRPDATHVGGFGFWRGLDRHVLRGEKAIWILAPMVARGEEDGERIVRGFKFVPVFDVGQTAGAPLSTICARLEGSDPYGHYAALVGVAASFGYAVEATELTGGSNGECHHARRVLRVEARNRPAQQVKTLAHELAHALMHERCTDRALAELEAESTAYIVCQALGLDTSAYSFGYVLTWAGGGEAALAAIRASGARIQQSAARLLDALEVASTRPDRNSSLCTSVIDERTPSEPQITSRLARQLT